MMEGGYLIIIAVLAAGSVIQMIAVVTAPWWCRG